MKLDESDVNNLPAYAVYQNLIPGVKVYQDTNQVTARQQRKRKSSNSVKPEQDSASTVGNTNQSSVAGEGPKKKKKKQKKKKGSGNNGNVSATEILTNPVSTSKSDTSREPQSGGKGKKEAPGVSKANGHGEKNGSAATVPEKTNKPDAKGLKKKKNKGKGKTPEAALKPQVEQSEKAKKKKKAGAAENGNPKEVDGKNNQVVAMVTKKKKNKEGGERTEEAQAIPLKSLMSGRRIEDSVKHGKDMFQWLIHPVPVKKFMDEHWEKKPLHIKRSDANPDYYKWILSSSKLDDIMRKNVIRFGKNIDITSFTDGQRETHNPVGRAVPAAVWDYYSNGCSVRFLNPQTYSKPLWRLNAILQEYFGTFVGANVYLTPPDTQGFAPHYDDIEAFILQLEGKKHWKVYKPRNPDEELARFSSPNFSEEDDNIGEPVLDVVVEEGDLLYFPRGYVHQGKAVGEHSLHVTLSCYQLNSWGDMLKEYFSAAVDRAMATNVEFRRGLPLDYLSYMGLAHQDSKKKLVVKKRKKFMKHVKKLVKDLVDTNTPDAATDQTGKKFLWDSLPPFLTEEEKSTTSANDGEFMDEGEVFNRCELDPDVEVKLVRKNCVRLVFEENTYRLYFTLENSMEYHGEEPQYVEIPEESVLAMKHLFKSYPKFVKIEDLPIDDLTAKIQLVADLWERGILTTKEPLAPAAFDDGDFMSDDDEDDDDGEDVGSDGDEFSDEEEDDEYSDGFDEFIDDGDIEYYDDGEDEDDEDDEGDYVDSQDDVEDEELDEHYVDEQDADYSDYSGDSETTEDSLGKSYIEEVHSDDEGAGDDDEVAPKLVAPSPRAKPKKSISKN